MTTQHINDTMTDPTNRTRLREAATSAFAENGFHATTTRDIAAAAGMSPAALYIHHRSKQDLLHVISRDGHQEVLQLVRDASASSGGPEDRLAEVIRALAAYHAENHTIARTVNYEIHSLSPAQQAEIGGLRTAVLREVQAVVEDGVEAGVFDAPDPELTTLVLLSLCVDISRWYEQDRPWSPGELSDYASVVALNAVRPRSGQRIDAATRQPSTRSASERMATR
ncbi:putative transcriptional regulator [Nostocoides japonicum T1-X7]|uniref:Putative transcriptional regulator n=1 Tax=Nostocoides japonicum T1-X7 TaxID=1194083 RepID=A0A077M5H9_9MICO|nr:TetR/AcrR family transcriptional regulator [Tetrasphaera japonica]CCH79419.1 putative transcriptional regulator [Tetrasphaera japonica T1-X7]